MGWTIVVMLRSFWGKWALIFSKTPFFQKNLNLKGAQFFIGAGRGDGGWRGWAGCDLHTNYGIVVILLSFLCNYDNLTLKLHQRKRCYPDKGWLFIGRFKKFEVCQEWALLLKHLKNPSWVWCEAIDKVI